jgi:hypothetical protein
MWNAPLGLEGRFKAIEIERFMCAASDHFVDGDKMVGGSRRGEDAKGY